MSAIPALIKRDGAACHYCKGPLLYPIPNDVVWSMHDGHLLWHRDGAATIYDTDLGIYRREAIPELAGVLPAQVDHKTPRARGGLNEMTNLVVACPSCNARKGTRPYLDFLFESWCR